jgi:hypothetical protein
MKKWKFEEELLSFLLPHMADKPRVTSMDLSSDESRDSTAENRSAENTQATENTQASELVDNSVETPSRPLQEAIPTPTSSLKRNHPRQRQISGKKQSAPIPETSSSTLMKYILDQKKTTEQIQLKNGLDFFYGIKETVKAFSPQDQYLAKKKIFETVSEIEGKYLNTPNNPQSIQHYPNALQPRHHVSLIPSGPSSSQSAASSSCGSYLQNFSPQYDEHPTGNCSNAAFAQYQ